MARFSQFAVAAARMAIADSGLKVDNEDATRIGVLIGNGNGGLPDIDEAVHDDRREGRQPAGPLLHVEDAAEHRRGAGRDALGLKGYNNTVGTACAAGTQAMGDAAATSSASAAPTSCSPAAARRASASSGSPASTSCAPSRRATTTAEARQPPVRRGPRRLRLRRGRRHLRPRDAGARPEARRAHPRRARRLRRHAPTPTTSSRPAWTATARQRAMQLALADAGVEPERRRLHQRPRHLDPAQRRRGDRRDQAASSASAPTRSR